MHLLSAIPGTVNDGTEAIDLSQSPADIVFMTSADTEIACLAKAHQNLLNIHAREVPTLRVCNMLYLGHPYSVDLYLEKTASQAQIIVARVLGGKAYFEYGIEELSKLCHQKNISLVLLPGDTTFDTDLFSLSTVGEKTYRDLWAYMVEGGVENSENFLISIAQIINKKYAEPMDSKPLLKAGIYSRGKNHSDTLKLGWHENRATVAIVFYRALMQSANTAVIDTLCDSLESVGINPLPIYTTSLKDPVAGVIVNDILVNNSVSVILNGTGFAIKSPNGKWVSTPYDQSDCAIFQIIFSGSAKSVWADSTAGLSVRDVAMNVALPEIDGRIITTAVSFKGDTVRDENIQADIVSYSPAKDRCDAVAKMALGQANLRHKKSTDKSVAIIMANYPNKDGRLANGVGLDTPAGVIEILHDLNKQGYAVGTIFENGNALIDHMKLGVTNAGTHGRIIRCSLDALSYEKYFKALPLTVQNSINTQWGAYKEDPFYMDRENGFALPIFPQGKSFIGLQPARGYNIDPTKTYHDADLVPPHGYLAFYMYLKDHHDVDAFIHMGKHGNMEWLPGKSTALSQACYPEAVFGYKPHFYPFIVNDPGEGTQAKRRSHAVIIDHMTPPLTRAETYGEMKDLERLIDEYFDASSLDPRRLKILKQDILDTAFRTGLAQDLGLDIVGNDDNLGKIDAYLCELKEMQIRDGLHIFGVSPMGEQRRDLLIALARAPRGEGKDSNASFIRALCDDLGLEFDPLDCPMGDTFVGSVPSVCLELVSPLRTNGDMIEALELLAIEILDEKISCVGKKSQAVYSQILAVLAPAIDICGESELKGLTTGLQGRFVPSGPSGAPTRGRPDVLPTGKNFYSVDTRAVPTQSAWKLGWKSAGLLLDKYVQDNGEYPKSMVVSAWGTANMRTGGDDIAQVLALLGAKPSWDNVTGKVTGFEILPLSILNRPRIDVTLRVSGFFRDAFSNLMELVDSVVRQIARLDEPLDMNPIKKKYQEDLQLYSDRDDTEFLAGARVFGSKPGAYGAGMQALMDEGIWQNDKDLAETYVNWGGYAYGAGVEGVSAKDTFITRLQQTQLVVQNQDNREHDILDSDDYYQFEGGVTAAIRHYSGTQPEIYHTDHSRIETPVIRTLNEEISRVVRGRASNPKWIAGVMRHGYKGAFEISATLDYLYAFAATAKVVSDNHFDQLFEAYINDDVVREFLQENNPDALQDIILKFKDAIDRNLWQNQRRNSTEETLNYYLKEKKDV